MTSTVVAGADNRARYAYPVLRLREDGIRGAAGANNERMGVGCSCQRDARDQKQADNNLCKTRYSSKKRGKNVAPNRDTFLCQKGKPGGFDAKLAYPVPFSQKLVCMCLNDPCPAGGGEL